MPELRARPASSPPSTYSASRPVAAPRAPPSGSAHVPSGRDLVVIGALAVAVRAALFIAATRTAGWSLTTFAELHDGASYLRVAADMVDPSTVVAHFDRRVFIGYPSLIAALSLSGLPVAIAALAVSWLASAAAAVASAMLFADRRVGWALAMFPPSFLLFSTIVMSEGTLLALLAVGVYCVIRRQALVVGALLLGYAGLVRPVACFAVLGVLAVFAYRKQWGRGIVVGGVSAAVVAAGFFALRLWRGDALEGVKIYAKSKHSFDGELFTWPFASLLTTPFEHSVSLWKIAYVWTCVVFVITGCVIAVRKWTLLRGSPLGDLALVAAVWLVANTLFVLCMGNKYGFHYFDRHIIAALPPLLWAYRAYFPRRVWVWTLSGAASIALGLSGILASVV